MTRVFLKLYLLLVLPLVLMAMLPQSPLSSLGEWWFEKEAYRQYGALYSLIKEELDPIPQSQWEDKVTSIAKNFAYPLTLKKRNEIKLKQAAFDKLDDKGYALIKYHRNNTLIFSVENSEFVLLASLYSRNTSLEEFEKDTRGFRYLLNKKITESENPIDEFKNNIKPLFSIDLEMFTIKDFTKTYGDTKLVSSLLKNKLSIDFEDSNRAYLLSEDKQYVVAIKGVNKRATYRRYYSFLSFLVPALLLAIGALIWIYLFRGEFKKVNHSAKAFGKGDLDARINLSKNSALYPIAGSFNNMAERIQTLIDRQRELTNAVSHELKTPLSRLHYALELQKTSNNDYEKEKYTKNIESNIFALEALVDELLSYTRLQTTQILTLKNHNIKPWIKKELDNFAEYHPKVLIKLTCNSNSMSVFDEHLLSRAFNNILENAARYADKDKPVIYISFYVKNKETLLAIEDNGTGIKERNRESIFEPFTRLDASRQRYEDSDALGGYGIGLSIVKKIMLQHKGNVICSDSNLGGAKFVLMWPIHSMT